MRFLVSSHPVIGIEGLVCRRRNRAGYPFAWEWCRCERHCHSLLTIAGLETMQRSGKLVWARRWMIASNTRFTGTRRKGKEFRRAPPRGHRRLSFPFHMAISFALLSKTGKQKKQAAFPLPVVNMKIRLLFIHHRLLHHHHRWRRSLHRACS